MPSLLHEGLVQLVRDRPELAATLGSSLPRAAEPPVKKPFQLLEASIDDVHAGIRSGATTCKQLVEGYLARARAYNGVCTMPVTADGAKIPKVAGVVRAGKPLTFPTQSVAIARLYPDFDQYVGNRPDYGRMEPTKSDPSRRYFHHRK